MKKKSFFVVTKVTFVLIMLLFSFAQTGSSLSKSDFIEEDEIGNIAFKHVSFISEKIGARPTATDNEINTQNYITDVFEDLDYDVIKQPFHFIEEEIPYSSTNIIAIKPGESEKVLIVGAHYDSVPEVKCSNPDMVLTGAGDNASGIGVMLEVAELLSEIETEVTIKFIAFGAEEMGLHGSTYFAKNMSQKEIKNTIGMINLDSVGVGDFFYVYSGLDNNPAWIRDFALEIGRSLPYDLRTSPESEFFKYGTTGDWSDHVPFRMLGIPIAYFEWVNWDIELNGGVETAEHGWVMHTCKDNLDFVKFDKIKATAHVLVSLLAEISESNAPAPSNRAIPSLGPMTIQHRYPH